MIAYKFLGPGRVGLFSGFRWPERGVVRAAVGVDPCRSGLHVCRVSDLPFWIDDELWEVELAQPVIELETLVVTERATVLRQIGGWDAERAGRFAADCLEQVREAAGHPGGTGESRAEAAAFAADLSDLLRGGRPNGIEPLAGEGAPTPGAVAANLGFVAAHALGRIATLATGEAKAYDLAVTRERERQQRWLEALLTH